MLQPKINGISHEDYFRMEDRAETKSEFFHGEIFAMTGASVQHNLIASNLIASLANALKGRECFVFPGDIKLQVDAKTHYTYPDVSVVCGDIEYAENRDDTIVNPILIVEILSESTKDYDRGTKFKAYRRISSLRHYLLVDQYGVSVEHFFRSEKGPWTLSEHHRPEETIRLEGLSIDVALKDIYHRIRFD